MIGKEQLLRNVVNFIKQADIYKYVNIIIEKITSCKVSHYIVGGTLRDLIISTIRNKRNLSIQEIDIVVEATSFDELVKMVSCINFVNETKLVKHPQFFTMSILLKTVDGDMRIDLSLPRKEEYPYPGSLPKVSLGSIDEDLFRRDFTINAIALRYDTVSGKYCFYDPFGGIEDIYRKHLRIMHDKSFIDDPTRIIRGIRFAAKLKFKFDPWTKKCLYEAVKKDMLMKISHKRLVNEFVHILRKGDNLYLVAKMFKEFGIDRVYKKRLGNLIEVFLSNCREIELKCLKNEDKFYTRLLFLMENTAGEILTLGKNKAISEFKKIMVNLQLTRTQRMPIYDAIHLLTSSAQQKNFPSWLIKYIKLFK